MPYVHTDEMAVNGTPVSRKEDANMPIAIVGMACRFPGDATSPTRFFDMLTKGRAAWSEIPKDRYNVEAFWHPNDARQGTTTARGGHFMKEDLGLFDAPFFSMSAAEATATDPQVRLLLEIAYESLENAGLPMETIVGSDTSCYVGCSSKDYDAMAGSDIDNTPLYEAIGSGYAMMANRVSHFFDFSGPSLTLDTACSSSMIALHLGCQSIRNGESRMSVIGSSQMIFLPNMAACLSSLHFLSPDSRCYSFDDRANGYSRGEGACVMVLKALEDAIHDGDTIRAVIRGSGTNHDGKTPGITQPSSDAQAALIRSTYKAAGLDFADTQYFEAHGTGTPVGDPLELGALGATFGSAKRTGDQPLYVGSVKTNIGHLEAGAGLAGLLKSVLSLENAVIPPSLNFRNPNPRLRLDEWNLKVPTKLIPWPSDGVRRASVNSFGYGGSNAHCIVDDAYNYLKTRGLRGKTNTVSLPPLSLDEDTDSDRGIRDDSPANNDSDSGPETRGFSLSKVNTSTSVTTVDSGSTLSDNDELLVKTKLRPRLFALSSPEQDNLSHLASSYAEYLNEKISNTTSTSNFSLDNLAFTLGVRRSVFPWRASFIASSSGDLASSLTQKIKVVRAKKPPKSLFIFTGQGAQWHAMGRELMIYDVYARTIKEADEYLTSLGSEWSVLSELGASEEKSQISLAKFSQPLCAVLQIALVNLLAHWGIKPTAVVGHSSGEIAAAYAMGALSAQDCWKIAYHRGRLSHAVKEIAPTLDGGMMAVGLSAIDVQPYLNSLPPSDVAIVACVNSPSNVTISGDSQALKKLEETLQSANIFARRLKVENAYHSPHMQVIAKEYLASIESIQTLPAESAPIMISSVTGLQIAPSQLDASYWVQNMVSPVRFDKAVSAILLAAPSKARRRRRDGLVVDELLEVGPHSALQGPLKQILTAADKTDITYLALLKRGQDATTTTLEAIGQMWTRGQTVNLLRVNSPELNPKPLTCLTDMPGYSWNHSRKYWHEPRPVSNFRFGKTPRLDLLGKPLSDNPLNPTWANVIRRSEIPWVADHVVEGDMLFPAAGMLCAVLEAARQIADKTKVVQEYEFRDILISRALVVPQDEGIAIVLHIKPRKIGTQGTDAPWLEFTVYSQSNDGECAEHCSGLLQILYRSSVNETERSAEAAAEWMSLQQEYKDAQQACTENYTQDHFYKELGVKKRDMYYGPTFQCLIDIKGMGNTVCTTVEIQDTKAIMPANFEYDHLIHPSTLDGVFQTFGVACFGKSEGPLVPTAIKSMIISANLPQGTGAKFRGFAKISRNGYRNYTGDVIMSDESWTEPKILIRRYESTELTRSAHESTSTGPSSSAIRKMCSQLVWKQDITYVEQSEADNIFRPKKLIDVDHAVACEKAAIIYMARALSGLTPEIEAAMPPHLLQHTKWMRQRISHAKLGETDHGHATTEWLTMDPKDEELFLRSIPEGDIHGQLLRAIGSNLLGILGGSMPPLPIMLNDDMLMKFYSNAPCKRMVLEYLDLQGYKRPNYEVLELGGGTASLTQTILETLGGHKGSTPRSDRYVFSDADVSCIENAQKLLQDWQGLLEYKKLDIEKDILDQGFEEESFDIIVAGNLLIGTKHIGITLANCHRLLKPGGKLILAEFTRPLDHISLVLGTLPSWWAAEDDRVDGPLIDEPTWNRHLLESNFSGLDLVVKDSQDNRNHYSSMIITTKPKKSELPFTKVAIIKPAKPSEASEALSANISRQLSDMGLEVEHLALEDAAASDANGTSYVSGKAIMSLLECENPFVYDLAETDFNMLKKILIHSLGGLWIGRAGGVLNPSDPSFCATTGLLRVLRGEHPDARIHEFNFSSQIEISGPEAADLVGRAFNSIFSEDPSFAETEIAEFNGRLYIPRLFDEKHKNHSLQMHGRQPEPRLEPFCQPERPLMLNIGAPGQLDTLHFIDDPKHLEPLTGSYVELEVQATAMNFVDIMVSMGIIPDTELGVDAAGIIKRVGPDVTLVKPGDRIATCQFGTYCNLIRVPESLVQKLPDNMSIEDGASLSCVYVTVYQGLVEVGRLVRGETILIHSAAGGLGQAAIQLAKHIGAEIFVTAGSPTKRRLLMDQYDIPSDHVFNSRDLAFAKGIMRMTNGKGVDVILNSLAGDALRKTWECIAQFGRFIEVGKKDILCNSGLEMIPFLRNVTFAGVNIEHMSRQNKPLLARLYQKTFDLIRDGVVGPVKPVTVYHYSEIEKAFRFMQQAKHVGKIVLKVHPDDMVPVIPRNPHPLVLNDVATYVLVGGLGGIGRAVATYMAEHGAKHLAFISRSGDSKPEAKEAIEELRKLDVDAIAYACDVADAVALEATLVKMSAEMPRIKGVIQSAMVLEDMYFEEMTYQPWITSTRPKIQGTWNLHQLLPKDLDFFVMLSSVSGISGNGAQSNYAAGNTYLDGLAHYRRQQGLAACSLDLGAIMGVGWMAENVNMSAEAQADWARISLQPHELYSLIGSAMTGYSDGDVRMPIQMVTGAGTGGIGQQMETLKTSSAFDDPKYSYLRRLDARRELLTAEDSTSQLKQSLSSATTLAQAGELIEGGLATKLSKSLSIAVEDVDTSKAVYSYGVDSLVAIEIRNWIFKELKSQVSVFDILSKVPMSQLALKIAKKSSFVPAEIQSSGKEA